MISKNKIIYVLAVIALIISLFHFSQTYSKAYYFTIHDFLDNPDQFHGEKKNVMGPFGGTSENGFYVIQNKRKVEIKHDGEFIPPVFGEVLVHGTLNKEGYVEPIGIHNYNYNFLLYILSGLSGIIVIILFFKEWKITKRGFESA